MSMIEPKCASIKWQIIELQGCVDGLKKRIVNILQQNLNPLLLAQVEVFQSALLNKDVIISLLRHDLATNDDRLSKRPFEQKAIDVEAQIQKDIEKLKDEMMAMSAQLFAIDPTIKKRN